VTQFNNEHASHLQLKKCESNEMKSGFHDGLKILCVLMKITSKLSRRHELVPVKKILTVQASVLRGESISPLILKD
jgi:hypothetical protein